MIDGLFARIILKVVGSQFQIYDREFIFNYDLELYIESTFFFFLEFSFRWSSFFFFCMLVIKYYLDDWFSAQGIFTRMKGDVE